MIAARARFSFLLSLFAGAALAACGSSSGSSTPSSAGAGAAGGASGSGGTQAGAAGGAKGGASGKGGSATGATSGAGTGGSSKGGAGGSGAGTSGAAGKGNAGGAGGSGAGGAAGGAGGAGATGGGAGMSGGSGGSSGGPLVGPASVLQHHHHDNRDGVYVDGAFTKTASATLHLDTTFDGTITGNMYGQVLYVDDPAGNDLVIAATESDQVFALDAKTGATVWVQTVGQPATLNDLPCGNIDPMGITSTPVIDPATRTLYLDAMTLENGNPKHKAYALSVDDGTVKPGWPVDLDTAVSGFQSPVQGERGALLIFGDSIYIPYGGHYGDCGNYHGWVVGIGLGDPTQVSSWKTVERAGGIWAPGGLASDGTFFYGTTGNTFDSGASWGNGEGVLRFGAGAIFTGQTQDFYAPNNWHQLDDSDTDLSGSGPLIVDLPGSTPSKLIVQLGKDGNAYILDRDNLGGFGAELFSKQVSVEEIIQAGAVYTTANGTYVVFRGAGAACPSGQSGELTALKLAPGSPPTLSVAWCANQHGKGSPMVTTTDGTNETIVWASSSGGKGKLYGFDGDTGAVVFDGGQPADEMGNLRAYITPIAAKGRIFLGGDDKVYAFTPLNLV